MFNVKFSLELTRKTPTSTDCRFNVSTAIDSEKVQLWRLANRKSSRAFQRAVDGVRTSPLSPPKDGLKPIFQFFWIKFNFNRIQSAAKFRCVKTSIGRVVEQSISYEITEKYRTESVSFHLKYWLKLTYPVVASARHAVSAAEWCDV